MDTKISSFGLVGVWVRVGDDEIQLEAAQDAQLSASMNLEDLMGDNALAPLDVQPKSLAIEVRGRNGKVSLEGMQALLGGTYVDNAAGAVVGPDEENGGCSMKNAIAVNSHVDANLLTNTYSFVAVTTSTFKVIRNSDGAVLGTFDCASYPRTDIIPGVNLTVNGTLVAGSWASIKTVGPGDSIQTLSNDKGDFPSQVALRCVSEDLPGQGQLEVLIYKAQPAGLTVPYATKTFALVDFNFRALFDSNVGKILEIRKYVKPVTSC